MLYIRFLNLQNPLQDVEQLYNDGTIKQGDIVCQQYNDKYSHLFMNGTWVKTKYTSKIAQNTEIEDDVKTLYDLISNNSTNITDISTRLSDNYITKSQYLEDEELIASSFAYVNNKINDQTELLDKNIRDISTNLSNISTNLSDNYITKSQYLKDEKLIASTFADVNNKINSLYAEIAELKEQLKSSTK
ncbi:MAG: hypothetical protein [Vetruanivirus porcinprimi]|uniref:Tail fiber protein n=1 Tax=phage Lak_Megaphage_RVC_AP1_GC26 TaxID=3109224 RepID=A0ABZ0Z487_9CAUD|nr:MAG: hypothetical protein [phage Lak_Megaphage_RVC_AP1_GC26]